MRNTIAPTTPQNSTRCWYFAGSVKAAKIRMKTKTLSTDSDFSITYPVIHWTPSSVPRTTKTPAAKARASPIQKTLHPSASRFDTSWASRWSTKRSSASIARTKAQNRNHGKRSPNMKSLLRQVRSRTRSARSHREWLLAAAPALIARVDDAGPPGAAVVTPLSPTSVWGGGVRLQWEWSVGALQVRELPPITASEGSGFPGNLLIHGNPGQQAEVPLHCRLFVRSKPKKATRNG